MPPEAASVETGFSPFSLLASRRLLLMLGVAVYVEFFVVAYRVWLSPAWGYLGFLYKPIPPGYDMAAWILCLLPCLWISIDLKRPTMLIYWVLYLTVYVPTMFVPFFIGARPPEDVLAMILTMLGGMVILELGYRMPLLKLQSRPIPPRLFWLLITLFTMLLVAGVVVVFRGKMKLVSMEDIYGQRAEAKAVLSGSILIGYCVTLLQGMVAPLLMTFALVRRKYWLFGVGFAIQVLIYACTASKGALASTVFSVAFYVLLRRSTRNFGLTLTWWLAIFTAAVAVAAAVQPVSANSFLAKVASILILRTIGAPGLLAGEYQGFFAHHPLTYLSHVSGISQFVHYPYPQSIGIMVGYYYTGNADYNANANMWLTDGIAAFGLPGIIFISLLAVLLFWLVDSAAQRHSTLFGAVVLAYAALNLSNVSLFTTLISGGLLPLMVLLNFMPAMGGEEGPARRGLLRFLF